MVTKDLHHDPGHCHHCLGHCPEFVATWDMGSGWATSFPAIHGAAGHGGSRGRSAPPVSFMPAPNSFRNPDRGINSVFVCKSVVLGRDEQPLGLT